MTNMTNKQTNKQTNTPTNKQTQTFGLIMLVRLKKIKQHCQFVSAVIKQKQTNKQTNKQKNKPFSKILPAY